MDRVEDAIRDALLAAKLAGMSKVDFDWAVERVKADSLSWAAMKETEGLTEHEARLIWIERGGNIG
jgi:hypothetical protein